MRSAQVLVGFWSGSALVLLGFGSDLGQVLLGFWLGSALVLLCFCFGSARVLVGFELGSGQIRVRFPNITNMRKDNTLMLMMSMFI